MHQFRLGVAVLVALGSSGCDTTSSDGPPADPPGTVTIDLLDGYGLDCETGDVNFRGLVSGLDLDLVGSNLGAPGGLIDVGLVSGLGAVDSIPTTGFVSTNAAIVGHGYVLRSDLDSYFRLFVVADLTATPSGRAGKTVKWAVMKALTSIDVAPEESTLRWVVSQRIQFAATGTYSDGTTADLTATAGWNSSAPNCNCTVSVGGCGLIPVTPWNLRGGLFTIVDCTGDWSFPAMPAAPAWVRATLAGITGEATITFTP